VHDDAKIGRRCGMYQRDLLAQHLREQSEWRAAKAEEYPEDARNRRCAEALANLAAYVDARPDDDPVIERLAAVAYFEDLYMPAEEAGRMISRYGFDRFTPPPDEFLGDLADAEGAEAVDRLLEDVATE
jgi:hypothetical protein